MNISTKHMKQLAKNTDEMMEIFYEFLSQDHPLIDKKIYIGSSYGKNLHLCPNFDSESFFENDKPLLFTSTNWPYDRAYQFVVSDFSFRRDHYDFNDWPKFIRRKLREISPEAEKEYVNDFYKARETELKEITKGFNKTTDQIIGGYRYVDKVLGD